MTLTIDPTLLKPIAPQHCLDWTIWQKKNLNIHRGLIEFTANRVDSIDDLAREVREGVRREFRPGWLRGFGFGTVIHFNDVPFDFAQICQHIDTRSSRHGVWQWIIVCFDEDKIAVAIHTWLKGYLRPIYDSVLQQLDDVGYECHSADAEVDILFTRLQSIAQTCRIIQHIGGIIT